MELSPKLNLFVISLGNLCTLGLVSLLHYLLEATLQQPNATLLAPLHHLQTFSRIHKRQALELEPSGLWYTVLAKAYVHTIN